MTDDQAPVSGKTASGRWWASDYTPAQLLRYGVVGLVNNLAGYLLYLGATYLGATPKITMTVLYAAGAAIGFWGNRRLTFAHEGDVIGTGAKYLVIQSMGYFLNFLILSIFVDKLGYPHEFVQAAAIFIVAAFLFSAYKLFVFKRPDRSEAE
jgi:putative flippase GtrA